MYSVQVDTFDDWRSHARWLLVNNAQPEFVTWNGDTQASLDLLSPNDTDSDGAIKKVKKSQDLTVPKEFITLAKTVACYREPQRWSLLYSVLWRLTHEEPALLRVVTDQQVHQLKSMQKAIHRDIHKMKAFVRFRKTEVEAQEYFIAWFEPEHLIIEYNAPFFVKRFSNMNWSILSPDACIHWDQKVLTVTGGAQKSMAVSEDSMESYWKQYYRSIFNPARLKEKAMQSEMPKKYWQYLPEAELIPELKRRAMSDTQTMLNNPLTDPDELRNKSRYLKSFQDKLRAENDI